MAVLVFNHGGGGGVSLKVVGGTVRPAGSENLIWIHTPAAFGRITAGESAPIGPSTGDVYIEVDPASDAAVQLGNGARIVRLPLGIVYQYDGTA